MHHAFLLLSFMRSAHLSASYAAVLLAFAMPFGAEALDVDCTAGALSSLVPGPETVTELRIRGTVDASDLFYIDSYMPALRALDIGAVTIAPYSGEVLRSHASYPAGTIPANAFAGNALTALTLPSAPTVLADGAFAGCGVLSLTLTPAVEATGSAVFAGCQALTRVVTGGAVLGSHVFAECTALADADLSGNTDVPVSAFAGCTALSDITGAVALVGIGAHAFEGCAALTSFAFGSQLETVGEFAFASSGLTVADMSASTGLGALNAWTFKNCRRLENVKLPARMSEVGQGAFFDCSVLKSVNFPAASVAEYTFKGAPLTDAAGLLPEGVVTIGDYALKDVTGVSALTLPSTLEYIGDGAMEGMTGLTQLDAQALERVPELGEAVWTGVRQQDVTLMTQPQMATVFVTAPQWQEFHIEATSTLVNGIETGKAFAGRFEGMTLRLRSQGGDITGIDIYNVSGDLLMHQPASSGDVSIDTSSLDGNIFVVVAHTADGRRAVLKLLR